MPQVVTCHCGAAYERTETRLIFWVMDDFCCYQCGEVLESWNGSRVPVYAPIQCRSGSATEPHDFFPQEVMSEAAEDQDALFGRGRGLRLARTL